MINFFRSKERKEEMEARLLAGKIDAAATFASTQSLRILSLSSVSQINLRSFGAASRLPFRQCRVLETAGEGEGCEGKEQEEGEIRNDQAFALERFHARRDH